MNANRDFDDDIPSTLAAFSKNMKKAEPPTDTPKHSTGNKSIQVSNASFQNVSGACTLTDVSTTTSDAASVVGRKVDGAGGSAAKQELAQTSTQGYSKQQSYLKIFESDLNKLLGSVDEKILPAENNQKLVKIDDILGTDEPTSSAGCNVKSACQKQLNYSGSGKTSHKPNEAILLTSVGDGVKLINDVNANEVYNKMSTTANTDSAIASQADSTMQNKNQTQSSVVGEITSVNSETASGLSINDNPINKILNLNKGDFVSPYVGYAAKNTVSATNFRRHSISIPIRNDSSSSDDEAILTQAQMEECIERIFNMKSHSERAEARPSATFGGFDAFARANATGASGDNCLPSGSSAQQLNYADQPGVTNVPVRAATSNGTSPVGGQMSDLSVSKSRKSRKQATPKKHTNEIASQTRDPDEQDYVNTPLAKRVTHVNFSSPRPTKKTLVDRAQSP